MKNAVVFTRFVQLVVVTLALVAALVLGFGLVPMVRAQTDIYVRPGGDDTECDGTADADYSPSVAPACAVQTIQRGIDLVNPGGTVHVAEGDYVEDLVITQSLTLAGAGQISTTIVPATSVPTCTTSSSLCSYNATSICLVQAGDVTIHDLTLDGDNPALNSGVIVNGVDVDARNGIISDYYLSAPIHNLDVYSVTVQNVYWRGIYASGTLAGIHVSGVDFYDNVVRNADGELGGSGGIILWNATGSMEGNTVEDTAHGASCWSESYCTIQDNEVTNARLAGVSAADDTIATLRNNSIYDAYRGVALSAEADRTVTAVLDSNLIDGIPPGGSGVYISGPGSTDVLLGNSLATANTFTDTNGFLVQLVDAADDDVPAYFNDWGYTNLSAIEGRIVHQNDTPALGEVIYYGLAAEAAPNLVTADGSDSATITATLSGLFAPQNITVGFATSLGTVNPTSDTTSPDGTATTEATSTSSGLATIVATAGYKNAQTSVNFIPLPPDHFAFALIEDQVAGVDFTITITAEDSDNNVETGYNGYVLLSDTTGTVAPTQAGPFSSGVWTGAISITQAYVGDVLTAAYPDPEYDVTGTSNVFTVAPSGENTYLPLISKN